MLKQSVIRQDSLSKEWMIVAPGRAGRFQGSKKDKDQSEMGSSLRWCPFCPGNESQTPPETFRVQKPDRSGWAVRVIPNKYSTVGAEGEPVRGEKGPFFAEWVGVGAHEVFVEAPHHDQKIASMTNTEVEHVLTAYQARYLALREDPRIKFITIFKNQGKMAGATMEHPHSQIVALPVVPMQVLRKIKIAMSHHKRTGRALCNDLVKEELHAKTRILMETKHFVVLHPFASRMPFETEIVPKHSCSSFGLASKEELAELAWVLRQSLVNLFQALGNFDFNLVVNTPPVDCDNKPYFPWNIQILPRLNWIAGFELGTGISITTISPEQSAAIVREVSS